MNCFATDTDCLHIKNVGTHHVRKRHTISTILVNGSCSFLFKLLHQNPFSMNVYVSSIVGIWHSYIVFSEYKFQNADP